MGKVTLDNITKIYSSRGEDIMAVEGLDLEIRDGEFLILVGPSGCGKSTTLRMVAGLESITDGTITIDDQVVNSKEPKERNIAMVFQNYALYPHKTVRENIGFGLKYSSDLSKEKIRERVDEAAGMMGIEDLLEDTPDQLSGGQRQRVALGRAIVREPDAYLFDEPLSNLDAKLRTHMRTEISRLQSDLDVTSLYVTHDQAEAMTMGDRIAVLNEGKLQQVGTPNEVYDHPVNKFVAGFIGSPSMNFAPATLQSNGSDAVLIDDQDGTVNFTLDQDILERLDASDGDDLVVGVRPEDITAVTGDTSVQDDKIIEATVEVVEPMGSDNFLTLDVGHGDAWSARVDSSYVPSEGTRVGITFDQEFLHLFESNGTTLKSQGLEKEAYHQQAAPTPGQ